MARSPITISPLIQSSGVQTLDTTNGNSLVGLGVGATGALMDRYYPFNFHMIYVTTGSGNIVVKAGYTPWAPQMSAGDLTIAVSGTNTVTDIGAQIQLGRHLKSASGDLYFDVDYTGGITGTVLVCLARSQSVPANTALNTIIKAEPSNLLVGAVVTTLGTAGLSIYDNAGSAQGTALLALAPSAAQGTMVSPGTKATNGLTVGGVANCPAVTVYYA